MSWSKECIISEISIAPRLPPNPDADLPVQEVADDDYTTSNLLDYMYHQKCYKVIDIDLSRQTNTNIPQQINFVGKLEEDNCEIIFFIAEKHQKTILIFSLDLLIVTQ